MKTAEKQAETDAAVRNEPLSLRYPAELIELIDQACRENHWTRASFVSRVLSIGLQTEFQRLGMADAAKRVKEIG